MEPKFIQGKFRYMVSKPVTKIVGEDMVMLNDKLLYLFNKKTGILKVSMPEEDLESLVEEIGFYRYPKDVILPTSEYNGYVTFKNVVDLESLLPEEDGHLLRYKSFRKPGMKVLTDYLKINPRNN